MSSSILQTHKWIRPPRSLDSFGHFLFEALDPRQFEAFLGFADTDDVPFVHPAVPAARLRELANLLAGADWEQQPREVFTEMFGLAGLPIGLKKRGLRYQLLRSERGSRPFGALAYLRRVELVTDPLEARAPLIEKFSRELFSCHRIVGRLSELTEQSDYLLSTVIRVGHLLLKRASHPQMLAALVDLAVHICRAEVGVLLVEDDSGKLAPQVELGLDPAIVTGISLLPDDETLIERLDRSHRAVVVDDVSGPTVRVPRPFEVRIVGLVAVPLVLDGQLLGVVCVATGESGRDISSNELRALETVTSVMAIAVQNDRLQRSRGSQTSTEPTLAPARRRWTPDLESLVALLEPVNQAVLIAAENGDLLHANAAAVKLFGERLECRVDEQRSRIVNDRLRRWLRRRWQSAMPGEHEPLPFLSERSLALEATFTPVPHARRGEGQPAWVTLVSEIEPCSRELSPRALADSLRSCLGRLQLGSDLLGSPCAADGEAASAEPVRGVLRRCHVELGLICEDLDEVERAGEAPPRRVCDLEHILGEAFRQMDELAPGEGWARLCAEAARGVLVLGDAWQLSRAFLRVLAQVRHVGGEASIPALEVGEDADRVRVQLVTPALTGPVEDALAELFEPLDPDRATGENDRLPVALQAAVGTFAAHGGKLRAIASSSRAFTVECSLPVAPGSQGTVATAVPCVTGEDGDHE